MTLGNCLVEGCADKAKYGTVVGSLCLYHWFSPELQHLVPHFCLHCRVATKPPEAPCCPRCCCRIPGCAQAMVARSSYCPLHRPCWYLGSPSRELRWREYHDRPCGAANAPCFYHGGRAALEACLAQRQLPAHICEAIAQYYTQAQFLSA